MLGVLRLGRLPRGWELPLWANWRPEEAAFAEGLKNCPCAALWEPAEVCEVCPCAGLWEPAEVRCFSCGVEAECRIFLAGGCKAASART